MADKKENSPALKRSWFQELKAEFGKITWPTKKNLFRQSVAVIVVAVLLGLMIVLLDYLITFGLGYILV
ncbi:MAG: preprotein translocase subunit SecE [Eubacterium sp.]|jgi:preprotein translocase subunit SecE|nr:preprotein translocase subunit SecE [Eubacterium sp.]HCA20780.1 preprotein translocase subunit SecE [Lachnospiraceae bacterium]